MAQLLHGNRGALKTMVLERDVDEDFTDVPDL